MNTGSFGKHSSLSSFRRRGCRSLLVSVGILAALLPAVAVSQEGGTSSTAAGVSILPGHTVLTGPQAYQQFLVQEVRGEQWGRQVRGDADGPPTSIEWTSSDPNVAVVEDGLVRARGDGTALIQARVGEELATAEVRVTGTGTPQRWEFTNHVLSVMTRLGCNSGACHGALAGKGGFKLSLRGYDPMADHHVITRQARGRRIELADPGRSLLLAKPSGALPHQGGLRFETDSLEYRVLAEWLTDGAPPPSEEDPALQRLEILPPLSLQTPGSRQQLVVRAHFTDGRVEDVTRWAKFASANERIATVDEAGEVTIEGNGEGAVTAWYLSRIVIARVVSPFPNPPHVTVGPPPRNFIDELVDSRLRGLRLPPSPRSSDSEFLRRAYLDTIGVLPTRDETTRFLADASPDKRDRLIDELLNREEFVDYWTYRWSDILLVNGRLLRPRAVQAYHAYVRQSVAANQPWDEFAREIVTSQGNSFEHGATNFFALHQDPLEMAENVSVAFMGLNINCARCHNHPLEKWTNDQYYAFANLFSRVRAKGWGGDARNGDGNRTLFVVGEGELVQPRTGHPQPPTPLDGEPLDMSDPGDRRQVLADWLTSPDNPYFSRAIANRIWANYLGVGLVEPVDDLRISNPPSNEALLSALADYLVEHDFDVKALMRAILQSNTYQRTSGPTPGNENDDRYYSRYYPRRLMAEVLLDAFSQVSSRPTAFTQRHNAGAGRENISDYPLGTRALELADSAVVSTFLETFGRNERAITCECERSSEPSMVQVLHIANGDTLNEKLAAEENRIATLLEQGLENDELVQEAFLLCLARFPTEEEQRQLTALMDGLEGDERRLAVEDMFWGIMSSREFLFNH